MLVTASTIKDTLGNVQWWVTANLASGIDRMVVFLDAPAEPGQEEVAAWLDAQPAVTCLRTGDEWWQGQRPGGLNVRQRINANWTRTLLEPCEWADWLFHVDGDEVVRVDRDVVAGIAADALWLPPLEAVSQSRPAHRPTRFKRLLDDDDLVLLQVLGVLPEATNQSFFHGHVMGKSGVRPSSGLALTLHDVVSPSGEPQPRHEHSSCAVLHYEAVSVDEFIRKWEALAAAGPARYRASRAPVARALRTLIRHDLPEDVRRTYLERIYDLTTRDDVDTLSELGLLVEVDPLSDPVAARPLPPGASEALAARVDEMLPAPKRPFFVQDAVKDRKREPSGSSTSRRRVPRRLRRLVNGG